MKLPLGFGTLDFSDWARGLISAFISGGSAAVVSGIVVSGADPAHFAPGTWDFFKLVGWVFMTSGALGAFTFLRTKPLPEVKTVERTVQTIDGPAGTKTVSTVKETSVEPASTKEPGK